MRFYRRSKSRLLALVTVFALLVAVAAPTFAAGEAVGTAEGVSVSDGLVAEDVGLRDAVSAEGSGAGEAPQGDAAEQSLASLRSVDFTLQAAQVWRVAFYDWDGRRISEQLVPDGGAAEPPEDPAREGYEFIGWKSDSNTTYEYISGATDFIAEYGELPIYNVRVNFVLEDKDGQTAAQPYIAAVHRGYNLVAVAPLPEISGYVCSVPLLPEGLTLEDGKLAINLPAVREDVSFTVYYRPTGAGYTVVHMQQKIDGKDGSDSDYKVVDEVFYPGVVGQQVTAEPAHYAGFTPKNESRSVVIAADGDTVIAIHYLRNQYAVYFDSNGGTHAEPISFLYGQKIEESGLPTGQDSPTRKAYAFKGWALEGGRLLGSDDFPLEPQGDLRLIAVWELLAEKNNYTLVYYLQDPNEQDKWHIKGFEVLEGNVGDRFGYAGQAAPYDIELPKTGGLYNLKDDATHTRYIDFDVDAIQDDPNHFYEVMEDKTQSANANVAVLAERVVEVPVYVRSKEFTLSFVNYVARSSLPGQNRLYMRDGTADLSRGNVEAVFADGTAKTLAGYKIKAKVGQDISKLWPKDIRGDADYYSIVPYSGDQLWDDRWLMIDPSHCTPVSLTSRSAIFNYVNISVNPEVEGEEGKANRQGFYMLNCHTFPSQLTTYLAALAGVQHYIPPAAAALGYAYEPVAPDEIALSLRYADASGNRDVNIVENFQNVPEPGESEGDKKYTERDNWKYNIEVKDSTRITYSTVYQGFGKAFVPDDAVYKDKFTENGEGIISANITEAGTPADNGNAYIMPAVYYERLRYSLVFITNGGRMDGAPKPQIEQKDVYYEEPIEKYKGVVKELRPPEGMDGAEVRWYSTAGLVTGTEVDISDPSILMPVGGLTLYAKWMDPSYEVSFRTGSEDVVPTQYVPKGGYAEEPDPAPIRDGYELVGWREEGKNYFFKFTNPIHGDKVLDAVWKARSDASVILRHHKAGTTESVWPDQEFDDLQVHSSYTLFSIPKERYLPNLISYALLVEPGKNEHTFIYSPYVLAEYTVEYRPADPADAAAGDFPQAKKVTTENNVVTELPVEVEGFYPVKSVLTRPLASDPAENVLVFEYARIGAVPYTVKIYTQNDDLSGYSERPDLTVTLYAEPGKRVTVTPGDVPGYSVNLSLSGLSGVVSSDGGTEIKLYYDFSYYTVRYAAGGGTGVMADDRYVRHGSLYRVRPNGFTRDGYSFDGWRSDQGDVIMPGGTFTITGDRTLTAIWVSVGAGDGSTGGGEPPTDNGGDDGSTGGGSGDNGGGGGVSPTPPTTPTGPSGAGDGVIPSVPVVQIAPPATPAAPAQLPTLAPPSFVQPAPSETPSGGNAPAPSLPSGLNDAYDEFLRAIDEAGIPLITMGNMPVPLYGIPGQPVWALLNLILAALTLLLSIYTLLYFLFRRRRYENEDMQELGPYTLDVKEFRMFPGVLAILTGPLSILVFLLTEDMRFFMVIVDRWTLLMALLFVAEALFLANAGRDARVEQQGVAV